MEATYENTIKLINNLPEEKIKEAFSNILYLCDMEEWVSMMELNSPVIMNNNADRLKDVNSGNLVSLKTVKRKNYSTPNK